MFAVVQRSSIPFSRSLPPSSFPFCGFFGVSQLQLGSKAGRGCWKDGYFSKIRKNGVLLGNLSQSFPHKIKTRDVLEQGMLPLSCCLGKIQELNVLFIDELKVGLICSRLA